MRVILSRKGLDSGNCTVSNLVVEDENGQTKIIMIPIPYNPNSKFKPDKDTYDNIKYSDNEKINNAIKNYLEKDADIKKNHPCHADPNLSFTFHNDISKTNKAKFRGAIGQNGAAQGHLKKNKIKENDIFIFFGRFTFAKMENRELVLKGKDKHLMFGYLQIGEIIETSNLKKTRDEYETDYPWIKYHPHWDEEKYRDIKENCIYVANKNLCDIENTPFQNIKGFGIFDYSDDLILTAEGKSLSKWNLPKELDGLEITYNKHARDYGDYFQSASRGQEFIIKDDSDRAAKWAINLIKNHTNQNSAK